MTAGRINPWLWLGLPMLICAALQLVFAIPIRVLGRGLPEPVFALAPTFAWAAARPSVLAPFAVLSLGVFLDLLLGAPSGLWPVSLLAAHGAGYLGRPLLAGQGMLALLAWYLGACAVAFAAAFAFTTLAAGEAPSLAAVAWQFLASSALFPAALYLTRRHEEANVGFR